MKCDIIRDAIEVYTDFINEKYNAKDFAEFSKRINIEVLYKYALEVKANTDEME